MYEAYFGLKENPFTLSPDPRYLYLSPQHQEALNCLIYGIARKKGSSSSRAGSGRQDDPLSRPSGRSGWNDGERADFQPRLSDIELLKTTTRSSGSGSWGGGRRNGIIDA